ncbi:MAG: alpha/beta fold hydrolase [Pseudomonadales bacterium]
MTNPPPLYHEVHPGNGPYLLLVHGFLMSRAQWQPNLAALSAVCRPVVVELPGHARSPAPEDPGAYTPAALAASLDTIRASLGVERWFLCGYSLGAGLTLRYALTWPQRVLAQAFTNSTSALADAAQQAAWREGGENSRLKFIEQGHAAIDRIAVHPRHAKRLPEVVKTPLLDDAATHSPLGIANVMAYTTPEISVRDLVARNSVPTLLIQGMRETRFAPFAEFARSHMPNLEVAELDTGHGVNMEDADAFNSALANFLARYRP